MIEILVRATRLEDLVEARLDCIDPGEQARDLHEIEKLIRNSPATVIWTFRPTQQGGQSDLSFEQRLAFWVSQNFAAESFLDFELDIAEALTSQRSVRKPFNWAQIICSHHDFDGVARDLEQIYERMVATPARILKIAVQADDVTDCIPVFRLLERAQREGREIIAVAMGMAGVATRILGPSRGAFLTYGALDKDHATAPGQTTAKDLRELYRIHKIDAHTQIMGVVGRPIAHSVSPQMHNAAFQAAGVNCVYIPLEVRDLGAFVKRMVHPRTREIEWNLRGLSITAPHKSSVIAYLDWVEPAAKEIAAVNTVVVEGDGLYGYNTDASALLQPIAKLGPLNASHCAIIGAGGAASAALWAMRQERASVTVFARDIAKAGSLCEKFGARCRNLDGARFEEFDLVINATNLGTKGQDEGQTPASALQLRGARFAYDLVYNPRETQFLREAREAGCEAIGGLPMLVAQACEQFKLWTGREGPGQVMHDAATLALDEEN